MSGPASIIAPLFVPADRPERVAKAASSGADAIIIDLEDAVAATAKDMARAALRSDIADRPVMVRVNGLASRWHAADMAAVLSHGFAGVVLPKAEFGPSFHQFCRSSPLPVIALVESAKGIAGARDIAAVENVVRLAFGSIDYSADLGCAHDRAALLTARCELILASRLAGIAAPLDGVTPSVDDAHLIEDDARNASALGFGGKLAIHPRQLPAIMAGFAPSAEEVEWAKRVLASGDGAVSVDGAMVDEPVRIRAKRVLARR